MVSSAPRYVVRLTFLAETTETETDRDGVGERARTNDDTVGVLLHHVARSRSPMRDQSFLHHLVRSRTACAASRSWTTASMIDRTCHSFCAFCTSFSPRSCKCRESHPSLPELPPRDSFLRSPTSFWLHPFLCGHARASPCSGLRRR